MFLCDGAYGRTDGGKRKREEDRGKTFLSFFASRGGGGGGQTRHRDRARTTSFLLVPLPTRKLRRKGTGVGGFRQKNWPAEKPPSQLNFGCRRKGLVLVESRAPQFSSSSSFPLRSPPPRAIDRGRKERRREDINRPDAEMDRKWNLCFRFRFFTFPGVYAHFSAKKVNPCAELSSYQNKVGT